MRLHINNSINLPQQYLITGDKPNETKRFLNQLEKCLINGVSLVQLRVKYLNNDDYRLLAKQAILLCNSYNAKILLNGNIQFTQELNADGVQLTREILLKHNSRPLSAKYIISASCHNEHELLHAKKINVDFVTLSPVFVTTSHSDAVTLGWKNFKKLAGLVDIPVFALGGLAMDDLGVAIKHGAYGIAAISAIWDK